MIMEFDINQLDCYLLKGKKGNNSKDLLRIYDLSFEAWHDSWEKTYQQDFHSSKTLNSDEFTRQDEIICLFYKGECFALSFFSCVDLLDKHALLDSYFNCWPKDAVEKLGAQGSNIIICSQFTICENFRSEATTFQGKSPWKILLAGIINKYFLESRKDAMCGTMRVNKGMDKFSYKLGALPLVEHMDYQAGADKTFVDLVVFYQNIVLETYQKNPYIEILDILWSNKNPKWLKLAA